jgi:predicted Ser/Thr protein kinase
MNFEKLNDYSYTYLKKMSINMNLPIRRSKNELIRDIINSLKEYEEYKNNKLDKYSKIKQIGNRGKEGTTYLVKNKDGVEFAMKTFRKSKSSNTLKKEYILQKKAAEFGVAPKVIDYDTVSKYIVMDLMDQPLLDIMTKQKGNILKYQQIQILDIFKKLDEAGVFHNDANISNYMLKDKQIFLIDYGMSREITPSLRKKLGTSTPNMNIMLLGFILKLREFKCPETSYKYLVPHLLPEQKIQFGL